MNPTGFRNSAKSLNPRYFRKIYKQNHTIVSDELTESVSAQSFSHRIDRKLELNQLFSLLTDYQKDLLTLKKDGYSIKELGLFFKKSPSSIKVAIHRAIDRLKYQNRRIK